MPHPTVPAPRAAQRDDPLWYAWLPLPDAAGDPDVPEEYLLRAGCTDVATLLALTTRPQRSLELTSWLVLLASTNGPHLPDEQRHQVLAAVLGFDDLTAGHVERLARNFTALAPDATVAFTALLAHPACTDTAVATVLVHFAGGLFTDEYPSMVAAAAAHGSLVPAAMSLLPSLAPSTDAARRTAVIALADRLAVTCGPNADIRRIVAALGPNWHADIDDLLKVAAAVHA